MAFFRVLKSSLHKEKFGFFYYNQLIEYKISPRTTKLLLLQLRSFSSTNIKFTQLPVQSNNDSNDFKNDHKDAPSANSASSSAVSSTSPHNQSPPVPSQGNNSNNNSLNSISRGNSSFKSTESTPNSSPSSIDINTIVKKYSPLSSRVNNYSPSSKLSSSEPTSDDFEEPVSVESPKTHSVDGDVGKELAGALNSSTLFLVFQSYLDITLAYSRCIDEVLNLLSRFYRLPEIRSLAKETGLNGSSFYFEF